MSDAAQRRYRILVGLFLYAQTYVYIICFDHISPVQAPLRCCSVKYASPLGGSHSFWSVQSRHSHRKFS